MDRSLEEEVALDRLLGRGEAQIAARGNQSTRGVQEVLGSVPSRLTRAGLGMRVCLRVGSVDPVQKPFQIITCCFVHSRPSMAPILPVFMVGH